MFSLPWKSLQSRGPVPTRPGRWNSPTSMPLLLTRRPPWGQCELHLGGHTLPVLGQRQLAHSCMAGIQLPYLSCLGCGGGQGSTLPTPWGSASRTPAEPGRGLAKGQWVAGQWRPSLACLASSKPMNSPRDRDVKREKLKAPFPPGPPFVDHPPPPPCPLLLAAPSLQVSWGPELMSVPHLEDLFCLSCHQR